MRHLAAVVFAVILPGAAASAEGLLPTGILRVSYIASNPVQASVDRSTGEIRGPGADLTRELARRIELNIVIKAAQGAAGVLNAVKNGEADIGLLAYDATRAAEVDFSQGYSLAQNTYLVASNSSIHSVAEIDKPGMRIGIADGDAGELFLTRNLKHATIKRNPGGDIAGGLKWLADGEIDAYAANRQRLSDIARRTKGVRLLPDNFYGVEQSIAVRKGNKELLALVDKFIDEAREAGLIEKAIARSGLLGVDVAPKATR